MTIPRTEIKAQFGKLLGFACLGNTIACDFLIDTLRVAHIWDDLIDRDRLTDNGTINEAFVLAFVNIPQNLFYRTHFYRLTEFIQRCMIDWMVANKWETSGCMTRQQAEIAYITRSSYTQLITEVALIVGGFDHALEIQQLVRMEMHDEGVDGYLESLQKEAI